MTSNLPFGNNPISVYMFEPFSFTISNPNTILYTLSTTITSGIPPPYLTSDVSRAVFATTSNGMLPGTQQFTVSTNQGGNIVGTSTNTVTIGPGRFLDGSGNSFVGSNYTFYAKEAITSIKLVAPFNLASPVTSSPVLPPGLSFTGLSGSNVYITGTPSVPSPQTNYLIIGRESGSSKTVSSTLPIVISNERIQTNITNGGIVANMEIGSAITPLTLTAAGNGSFQYTWLPFPDGIRATDNSGITVSSPFPPSDPSRTLIITGTPTLTTASNFAGAGYSNGLTQSITVQRTSPLPVISSSIPVTFRFAETVLFDTPPVASFFKNVPVSPGAIVYRAKTYFTSNVDITNISNVSTLPTGLSLTFDNLGQYAYLSGTPTVVTSGNYTLRATNSNGKQGDIAASISVANDSVTFPAIDACYNFVLSRPSDFPLNGYYPAPITFSATASSQKNIAWSSSGLTGTGLSLTNTSGPTTTLVGRPVAVTPLQTLSITATSFDTSESVTRDVSFAILDDSFTLSKPYYNSRLLVQNKPMTPIQFTASTLSGNPIRVWTATGLIPGTTLSAGGVLSGTPTAGGSVNPAYTLDTGFVTFPPYQPLDWGFVSATDVTLVTLPNITEYVSPTFSGLEFVPLAYSGTSNTSLDVSTSRGPWQGSNFTASFSGNYLQGDFSGIALLPKYRLGITGYSGAESNTWPLDINVVNAPTFTRHILGIDIPGSSSTLKLLRNTGPCVALDSSFGYTSVGTDLAWSNANVPSDILSNVEYGIHDMAQNGDVLVAVIGSNMLRSSNAGVTWDSIPSSNIQAISIGGGVPPSYSTSNPLFGCIATDGTSNWVTLANGWDGDEYSIIVRTSSNNGVNWTDTQVTYFVDINSNTKLFYNNSRYFVTPGASATNPVLYANASDLTTWTAPTLTAGDIFNDLAFSNNTVLAVGSNGSSSACYSSTNNGTSWTPLPSDPISYSGSAEINTAGYAYGKWAVAGRGAGGDPAISFSSNLTTWSQSNTGSGRLTATVEDGSGWLWAGTEGGITGVWNSSGNVDVGYVGWGSSTLPAEGSKRIVSTLVSNGSPFLALSMLYNSDGFAFDSPTKTDYIHWQYVPISTIHIEANSSIVPSEPVYYIITGLPDGLTLTLNPASSFSATITGTPVTYSDAPQIVRLYAVTSSNYYVNPLVMTMRVILPTVQKQQTSAGAWTSLVRQYTEVNAATTARDNKATPAIEYRLGEFTSPDPPSVVTASSNCLC